MRAGEHVFQCGPDRVAEADLYRGILVVAVRDAKNTVPHMADTMGETAYTTFVWEKAQTRLFQTHFAK